MSVEEAYNMLEEWSNGIITGISDKCLSTTLVTMNKYMEIQKLLSNEVYLIKKISFDSLENRINNVVCEENIGIMIDTEENVDKWISDHMPEKQYKGWDGKMYPYYTKTPVHIMKSNQEDS